MSLNDLPYEEYKGWYIGQGITMPAQGVYDVNIYSSKEKLFAETPDHIVAGVPEAYAWIDEEVLEHGRAIEFAESEAETLEEFERERGYGPLWEETKHGSYIIFTNLDTDETKQYYNAFPPDSS